MNRNQTEKPVKDRHGYHASRDHAMYDYMQTNLIRYRWVHELDVHFTEVLNAERPLEFLNRLQAITENIKFQSDNEEEILKFLNKVTDLLKIIISIKPRLAFDLKKNIEFNTELKTLSEMPSPKIGEVNILYPLTVKMEGQENTMKLAVSRFIEGLFYGTVQIHIFAKIQVFAGDGFQNLSVPQNINYKGLEMIYVLLDRTQGNYSF